MARGSCLSYPNYNQTIIAQLALCARGESKIYAITGLAAKAYFYWPGGFYKNMIAPIPCIIKIFAQHQCKFRIFLDRDNRLTLPASEILVYMPIKCCLESGRPQNR